MSDLTKEDVIKIIRASELPDQYGSVDIIEDRLIENIAQFITAREAIDDLQDGCHRHRKLVDELKAQLAALTQAHQQALEAIYIPGSWACTHCEFGQVITNLYVNSGTVGPNTDKVPICPNDGSLMRRCTWKERVKDDDKYIAERLDEIDQLKAQLQQSVESERETRRHLTATQAHLATVESGQAREDEIQILRDKIASWGDLDNQFHALQAQLQQAVEALAKVYTGVAKHARDVSFIMGNDMWRERAAMEDMAKYYDAKVLATHKEKV